MTLEEEIGKKIGRLHAEVALLSLTVEALTGMVSAAFAVLSENFPAEKVDPHIAKFRKEKEVKDDDLFRKYCTFNDG